MLNLWSLLFNLKLSLLHSMCVLNTAVHPFGANILLGSPPGSVKDLGTGNYQVLDPLGTLFRYDEQCS